MSTIQDNPVSPALLAAMNPSQSSAATSSASATQDRFLKLLVTQMKNQDPLNPLDNAQVTSQLAQLSTVTGIDKLNATVASLMSSYQASQSLQSANMVGHGILAAGSQISLANGAGMFGVELTQPADSVVVTISDASGKALHKIDLGAQEAGTLPLQWDGVTDSGGTAADGQYKFAVTASAAGQNITATPLAFGQVASVSTASDGVTLNVANIGAVKVADIKQIF